jgi:thymidylate synthase ThyX
MAYECRILADSISPLGVRLVTYLVSFPRFILAEINTHRMLSRNFESSRAVPVAKRIEAVREHPFIPEAFGSARKGMQAGADLDGLRDEQARDAWMDACRDACRSAETLALLGVHKQLANRVLEPFSFVSGVITATEWDNFFALRCHPDAQPEFQRLARMMRSARDASTPREIDFAEWHLPFGDPGDDWMVSAGRCARVSYNTHGGVRDPAADRALATRLQASGHMSPFEHAAIATGDSGFTGNFRGWVQARKLLPNEAVFRGGTP